MRRRLGGADRQDARALPARPYEKTGRAARSHSERRLSLTRLFWIGAAALLSVAALVAIVTILTRDFGETEGKLFATIATAFVAGSTAIAGVACLERGVARPAGLAGIVLALGAFALWTEQIWAEHESDGYWKLLGLVATWTLAVLIVVVARLLTRDARLVRTLFAGTAGAAMLAAVVMTVMILREQGDGWQLFGIGLILAVLGLLLTPIAHRLIGSQKPAAKAA